MKKNSVAVIMGSDTDFSIMRDALHVLESFNISHRVAILSAHRTPDELRSYVSEAISNRVKIFIAGAGGAAHLPGVIASFCSLPVIGVPIKTSVLDGVDSLYSIVQMPSGVPVATVGINASQNAALLAVEILSLFDQRLERKLKIYRKRIANEVVAKNRQLEKIKHKNKL